MRDYGTRNGFGWKQGTVVAVRVASRSDGRGSRRGARQAFTRISRGDGACIRVHFGSARLGALYVFVLRPVRRLSAFADRASTGETGMPEIPVQGQDEIARMTASFNRMYISLQKAMRMLEG